MGLQDNEMNNDNYIIVHPLQSYQSSILLKVVLSIALHCTRAYYPSLSDLSEEEVLGNREIQLAGVSTLARIINELVSIVKANGMLLDYK